MHIFVHFHSSVFLFLHIKQGPEIVFLVFHDLIFGLFEHRELVNIGIMWKPQSDQKHLKTAVAKHALILPFYLGSWE